MASATDARHLAKADGIHDPHLRASFAQLAERLTDTQRAVEALID